MLVELGDGAVVDQLALVDEQQAIGHRLHLLQDVRGKENRLVAPELADRLANFTNLIGVEPGGRFVENKDIRFVQQDLGHAHPLPVPAREFSDRFAENSLKGAQFDDGVDTVGSGRR